MNTDKPYSLEKVSKSFCFVIGKNDMRFLDLLPSVNEDLRMIKFKGQVVFDLLLSNGNNSKRYVQAVFNGEKVDLNNMFVVKDIPHEFFNVSNNFLRKNPEVLTFGVLSKAEIKRIQETILH